MEKKCKGVGILECEKNIRLDYNVAQKRAHFLICLEIKQSYIILLNFPFCLNLSLLPLEVLVVPQSGPFSFFFLHSHFYCIIVFNHKLTEGWKYSKIIIFKSLKISPWTNAPSPVNISMCIYLKYSTHSQCNHYSQEINQ